MRYIIIALIIFSAIAINQSAYAEWYDARDFYKMLNAQEKYYDKYYDEDDSYDDNDFFNGNSKDITVRIVIGEENKDRDDIPDFNIETKSTSEFIDSSDFRDDGKAKTVIETDIKDKRICIEAIDVHYKSCKNIKHDTNEVTFYPK